MFLYIQALTPISAYVSRITQFSLITSIDLELPIEPSIENQLPPFTLLVDFCQPSAFFKEVLIQDFFKVA